MTRLRLRLRLRLLVICLDVCLSVRGAGCGRALRKAAGGSSWHRYMYVEHDVHVEIVLPTLVQH